MCFNFISVRNIILLKKKTFSFFFFSVKSQPDSLNFIVFSAARMIHETSAHGRSTVIFGVVKTTSITCKQTESCLAGGFCLGNYYAPSALGPRPRSLEHDNDKIETVRGKTVENLLALHFDYPTEESTWIVRVL